MRVERETRIAVTSFIVVTIIAFGLALGINSWARHGALKGGDETYNYPLPIDVGFAVTVGIVVLLIIYIVHLIDE